MSDDINQAASEQPAPAAKERLTSEDVPGWYECIDRDDPRLKKVLWWDGRGFRFGPGDSGTFCAGCRFAGPLVHAPALEAQLATTQATLDQINAVLAISVKRTVELESQLAESRAECELLKEQLGKQEIILDKHESVKALQSLLTQANLAREKAEQERDAAVARLAKANTPFCDADNKIEIYKQEGYEFYSYSLPGLDSGPFTTWREAYAAAMGYLSWLAEKTARDAAESRIKELEQRLAEQLQVIHGPAVLPEGRWAVFRKSDNCYLGVFSRCDDLHTLNFALRLPEAGEGGGK